MGSRDVIICCAHNYHNAVYTCMILSRISLTNKLTHIEIHIILHIEYTY